MPKKPRETPSYSRLSVIVSNDMAARILEAQGALKRRGVAVSTSHLIEIALDELLRRRDLPAVMRKQHATARRE